MPACRTEETTTLYFAYTACLSPDRLSEVAPSASFRFIAHLPETKLVFPILDERWDGALPSVVPEPGNTVWGAIFEIPEDEVAALDAAELAEGRIPTTDFKAVDREGNRFPVVTHVHREVMNDGQVAPSRTYMELVVDGGRHWQLPTGWVAGLEEYVEEPLF